MTTEAPQTPPVPTDAELLAHLTTLGLDRWSQLRRTIEGARTTAENTRDPRSVATMTHVLQWMTDAENVEAAAMEIKRAELAGDMDAMLVAMAKMAAI